MVHQRQQPHGRQAAGRPPRHEHEEEEEAAALRHTIQKNRRSAHTTHEMYVIHSQGRFTYGTTSYPPPLPNSHPHTQTSLPTSTLDTPGYGEVVCPHGHVQYVMALALLSLISYMLPHYSYQYASAHHSWLPSQPARLPGMARSCASMAMSSAVRMAAMPPPPGACTTVSSGQHAAQKSHAASASRDLILRGDGKRRPDSHALVFTTIKVACLQTVVTRNMLTAR